MSFPSSLGHMYRPVQKPAGTGSTAGADQKTSKKPDPTQITVSAGTRDRVNTHRSWGQGLDRALTFLLTFSAITGTGARVLSGLPAPEPSIATAKDLVEAMGKFGGMTEFVGAGYYSNIPVGGASHWESDQGLTAREIATGLRHVGGGNSTFTVYQYTPGNKTGSSSDVPPPEDKKAPDGGNASTPPWLKTWSDPQDIPLLPGSTPLGAMSSTRMFLLKPSNVYFVQAMLERATEEMLVCAVQLSEEPRGTLAIAVMPDTTHARALLERVRCESGDNPLYWGGAVLALGGCVLVCAVRNCRFVDDYLDVASDVTHRGLQVASAGVQQMSDRVAGAMEDVVMSVREQTQRLQLFPARGRYQPVSMQAIDELQAPGAGPVPDQP